MTIEFVEVEFEDQRDLQLEVGELVDINDPRLTEEVVLDDPEGDAYAPNFAILRVRLETPRGLPLTIAEQQ